MTREEFVRKAVDAVIEEAVSAGGIGVGRWFAERAVEAAFGAVGAWELYQWAKTVEEAAIDDNDCCPMCGSHVLECYAGCSIRGLQGAIAKAEA